MKVLLVILSRVSN